MAGIIEDHEARLQILEAVRRGINSEITSQISKFASDLEAHSRRLTLMEANHTGLQHNEIAALGRRVHAVEVDIVGRLNKVGEDQAVLGADTRQLIETIQQECQAAITAEIERITSVTNRQNDELTNQLDKAFAVIVKQDIWIKRQEAWSSQSWWRRWWKRLRGEKP